MRVLSIACLAACGGSTPAPDADPAADVRAELPTPDSSFVDLVTPAFRIEPGREAIRCYYLDNPAGRFAADRIETRQGAGAHHIALRRATTPRPSGTFEDCTSDQEQRGFADLLLAPGPLPDGWAMEIPADTQLVLETHYIDATDQPLLARDVIRIHRIADAGVTKWIHAMHLKTYDLVVPPGTSTLAFDCAVGSDVALFQYWGHEHAAGTEVSVTLDGAPLYRVRWGVDAVIAGTTTQPVPVHAGSTLTTRCSWSNPGPTLRFPDEMCAFGGYVEGAELSCIGTSYAR